MYRAYSGAVRRASGSKSVFQATFDQLLAPDDAGCNHGESGPDGTHTAVEHQCGAQWVCLPYDLRICV